MCHRGVLQKDIKEKYNLCNKENNWIEHWINEFEKLQKERKNLITELNKLDEETKNKTLLKAIEYFYYS